MIEFAILTVYDRGNREIGDMELPVKMPVQELAVKLAAILQDMDPDRFYNLQNVEIMFNGRILEKDETLYQNGIWDGSGIKLMYE
jgi:hypothetical protein